MEKTTQKLYNETKELQLYIQMKQKKIINTNRYKADTMGGEEHTEAKSRLNVVF